jgi:two-component system response regulator
MKQDVILLVEDNTDEADLASMALESSIAAEVVHVRDGAEALDYLFGRGDLADRKTPVVVLLDLKLPKLGGIEVLKALRSDQRTRLIPVVVMTNSLDEHDVAAAYTNGCNSYVRKQVDWVEFKDTIRQVGTYWVVINEKLPRQVPGEAAP